MRVLMVGNDFSVKGGITSVITQLMSFNWEKDGVDMKFIPTYIDGNNLKKILFFCNSYFKIWNEIRNNKPDIVHIHMSYRGSFKRKYLIHELCVRYGIPDIIHLHGSEFEKWYNESNEKLKIKKLLKECSSFIVLGDKWDSIVKKIEPATKTIVVSNSISIPDYQVRWSTPLNVLFMGVLIKRKGVSDLLDAIKILNDDNKILNLNFVIAGTGNEKDKLEEKSKYMHIDKYVKFVGWVGPEDKNEIYKNSHILVLPSYNEGLPIAILEAISFGLPVISTNVGDISSAVLHGENGYLINPGDKQKLAEYIYLSTEKKLFEKFSNRSKEIAKDKFNENKFYSQILDLYMNLKK